MESIKVMIADDHPVVREGLSAMLNKEPDIQVVGEAENGAEAIKKASEFQPEIVLMDLRMPEVDGVEGAI
jgi:YesN/AraC family two-component response regulator